MANTNTTLFGLPYGDVANILLDGGGGVLMIDPGSFADTGETPVPLGFTATQSMGQFLVSGDYSKIIGALGLNPDWVDPNEGD